MSVFDKIYLAAFFTVLMFTIRECSAQNYQQCVDETVACSSNFLTSGDKEEICRFAQNYLKCLQNAIKVCSFGISIPIFDDAIQKAQQQISLNCSVSGSGIPAISVFSLIIVTLVYIL